MSWFWTGYLCGLGSGVVMTLLVLFCWLVLPYYEFKP